MNDSDNISGFYNDDGTPVDVNSIPKPCLCVICKKNRSEGMEEILCILTRADQKDNNEFNCFGYTPIF